MDEAIAVDVVPAWTTWPLRQEVLRPGRAVRDCVYPGEDDPRAAHAAALRREVASGGALVVLAVGVVIPEAPPWDADGDRSWRLRGMATRPAAQGQGLGRRVLDLLVGHVAAHGGGLLWCNARTPALALYERAGFVPRGEVFELPEIGPHLVMWRTVTPSDGAASRDEPASP
ncbi:MAG TPA: GNAT family N-acetyltransferase [Acidimicrobiales bacterium]|nr:GNAT family N-acetyltransferase [Acidimicrobiales bacterium]